MPALQFAAIDANDDSVDFSQFKKPIAVANGVSKAAKAAPTTRTLILAPPSIAAHEEKLHALFSVYDRAASDLQMLDRLAAGFVPLTPNTYDAVLVLTDTDGSQRPDALKLLTSRSVYAALVPAMKNGAQLKLQDGKPLEGADAREAILAGLVKTKDSTFEKVEEEEVVVPLRLRKKVVKPAAPAPKPAAPAKRSAVVLDLGEYSDGDELVDEDSLMTAEERNRPPQQPPCNVDGQKRRKPCKDCTCGLAERLEEEDRDRRVKADVDLASAKTNVFKFDADDLNELDFTVQGKTGSCNSCSLGDAFRCSTCPYIGLPAFKPGEEVKILSGLVQL